MKIILLEKIKNLGEKHAVVDVAPGYARNFLFKNGLAQPATVRGLDEVQVRQEAEEEKKGQERDRIKDLAGKIGEYKITIQKKVNKQGKLFGSVVEKDIIQAFSKEDIDLSDGKVMFSESIKELGKYRVKIIFSSDLESEFDLIVKEI